MAGQFSNYQQATHFPQTYQPQQPQVNVYPNNYTGQQSQLSNSLTSQPYQQGPYPQFSYTQIQQSPASQPFPQPQYTPQGYPVHQQAPPAYPIPPSMQQQQGDALQVGHQQPYTPYSQYGWPSVNPQVQEPYGLSSQQNNSQQSQASYGHPHPQGCFNCGRPGHWAQACPEPKRQVPAGTLNPAQHRRQGIAPPKRNNQIVTKFPPHAMSAQGSPLSAPSLFPTAGNWHYTAPRTPMTPQSGPSPAQSWPTHHQNSHYASSHLLAQASHQATVTPQIQYPDTPASVPSHDLASPGQDSPTTPYHNYSSQSVQEPPSQQIPPSRQASEVVHGYGGQPERTHDITKESHGQQGHHTDSGPIKMWSPSSNPYKDAVDIEIEDDDLNLLDIPELSPNAQVPSTALMSPIGMPIPSNFVVADALFPMMPPSAVDRGLCRSKYLRNLSEDALRSNIADSKYWKEHEDDTIFVDLLATDEVVTFEECRVRIWERRKPQDSQRHKSRSESGSVPPAKRDVTECAESLAQLERALADAKAKQAEMIANMERKRGLRRAPSQEMADPKHKIPLPAEQRSPPAAVQAESKDTESQQTRDVLASLGVTGTARAIRQTSQARQNELQSPSHSKSYGPRLQSIAPQNRASHHSHENIINHKHQQHSHPTDNGETSRQPAAEQSHHPQMSTPDNAVGPSPHITGFDHFGDPIVEYSESTSHNSLPRNGQNSHTRQDHSFYQQKRTYHSRESSSDDSDAPARRQEDDVSSKSKRRKPQVEDAYSRRW